MEQREIKFRAWFPKTRVMVVFDEFWSCFEYGSLAWRTNHEEYRGIANLPNDYDQVSVMQYTGLKDKNGKEIYESDYLGDWCVFWGSGKYILQNISTGDIMDCTQTTVYDKEITGNRYENPREHTAMETDL